MNSSLYLKTFFCIGVDKLSLCVFDGIKDKIFEKKISINRNIEKKELDELYEEFLGANILKVEKKIHKFVNEINLIIDDSNFLLIQASIKKDGRGDKISKTDLNHILFDLKQQIKENNPDKTITYIKINNFMLDKKMLLTLEDNFECDELCLNIDFVCLPNHIKKKYADIIKKYQIRIDQIFAAGYLSKNYKKGGEDLTQTAARLKYENDENEVHMIKKIPEKKGFFERFFRFFN